MCVCHIEAPCSSLSLYTQTIVTFTLRFMPSRSCAHIGFSVSLVFIYFNDISPHTCSANNVSFAVPFLLLLLLLPLSSLALSSLRFFFFFFFCSRSSRCTRHRNENLFCTKSNNRVKKLTEKNYAAHNRRDRVIYLLSAIITL